MRKKNLRKLNNLLVILAISIMTPLVVFAEEIPEDVTEADVVEVGIAEITEEEPCAELTSEAEAPEATPQAGITVDGKSANESLPITADDVPVFTASENSSDRPAVSTNFAYNASYVGKIEKKGVKFRVRIPYWFANTFPQAKFKVGKKTTKVVIPVCNPDGKKLTTRSLKLSTDSALWLGDYTRDDYYTCPPWLKKVFDDAVVEEIAKNAISENGMSYDYLVTWIPVYKNAKAKKKDSPVITRVIEYCTPKRYNVSAIETANYTHKGGFGLCD